MQNSLIKDRLRVQFILYDGLRAICALPLVSRDQAVTGLRGATLRSSEELLGLARAVGLDSLVQTTTVSEHPIRLLREFFVGTPESIVKRLEARVDAETEAEIKLLSGEKLNDLEKAALSPLEHFVLGASEVSPEEGLQRFKKWLDDRDAKLRP